MTPAQQSHLIIAHCSKKSNTDASKTRGAGCFNRIIMNAKIKKCQSHAPNMTSSWRSRKGKTTHSNSNTPNPKNNRARPRLNGVATDVQALAPVWPRICNQRHGPDTRQQQSCTGTKGSKHTKHTTHTLYFCKQSRSGLPTAFVQMWLPER